MVNSMCMLITLSKLAAFENDIQSRMQDKVLRTNHVNQKTEIIFKSKGPILLD